MDSSLRWFGSKFRMIPHILPILPSHLTWVDGFFGGGSVTFAKAPSPVEIINDLDRHVVQFFETLRDPAKAEALFRRAVFTPYSRELFEEMLESPIPTDDVERAYRFFVVNRMSFGGAMKSWSFSQTISRQNVAASVAVWLKGVDCLPQITTRLLSVQVEKSHFRDLIPRYDAPNTLFYLDPPYHPETRARGGYEVEMTAEEHEELAALLLEVTGKVILSGYAHPVYGPLEKAGWQRKEVETKIFASGKSAIKSRRLESLWVNPQAQRFGDLFSGLQEVA